MANSSFDTLVSYLHGMVPDRPQQDDGLLLTHFAQGDESAFASLVRRHAALVWGVCRRKLGNAQDAEDAFQATFLVLARKAPTLARIGPLGPWLHRVASRTAVKARVRAARLAARETAAAVEPSVESAPDTSQPELRAVLDEEVSRLPEKYRLPVVMCYLEGVTNEEAARRLALPRGTILSRLARAREKLKARLLRRGLGPCSAVGVAALSESAEVSIPSALVDKLLQAGPMLRTGKFSTSVITLTEGVFSSMFLPKLKVTALVLLAFALVASGAGWLAAQPETVTAQSTASPRPRADTGANHDKPEKKPSDPSKPTGINTKPNRVPDVADKQDAVPADLFKILARPIDFAGLEDVHTTLADAPGTPGT